MKTLTQRLRARLALDREPTDADEAVTLARAKVHGYDGLADDLKRAVDVSLERLVNEERRRWAEDVVRETFPAAEADPEAVVEGGDR